MANRSLRGMRIGSHSMETEDGVEFVDVTVGFDADVVFRHSSTAEETGVALVACLCVDLHWLEI